MQLTVTVTHFDFNEAARVVMKEPDLWSDEIVMHALS
jgi:hypothetical protein